MFHCKPVKRSSFWLLWVVLSTTLAPQCLYSVIFGTSSSKLCNPIYKWLCKTFSKYCYRSRSAQLTSAHLFVIRLHSLFDFQFLPTKQKWLRRRTKLFWSCCPRDLREEKMSGHQKFCKKLINVVSYRLIATQVDCLLLHDRDLGLSVFDFLNNLTTTTKCKTKLP